MIYKVIDDDTLFVFWNGWLIYKKWLKSGLGIVFDPYGPPWRDNSGKPY